MKKILLLACACILSVAAWSQTLRVDNVTGCPVIFRALASDNPFINPCNNAYGTNDIFLPAGASILLDISFLTTPPAGGFNWSYMRFRDPAIFSCPTGPTTPPCQYGINEIADPSCGTVPPNACITGAVCGPCAGTVTRADWIQLSPTDWRVVFHP